MMNLEKINYKELEKVAGGIFVSKNTDHGVYGHVAMAPLPFPRKKDPLFPSMPELGRRI